MSPTRLLSDLNLEGLVTDRREVTYSMYRYKYCVVACFPPQRGAFEEQIDHQLVQYQCHLPLGTVEAANVDRMKNLNHLLQQHHYLRLPFKRP
jgi:hypothetical protein